MRLWGMIIGLITIAIVVVPEARADFIGVPSATIGARNVGAGFYMDFSFREYDFTKVEETEEGAPITPRFNEGEQTTMESFRLGLKMGYGILDQLDVYGKIGASNIDNDDLDIEGEADLLYGGGVKVTVYKNEENRYKIGVGAQYTEFSTVVDDLTQQGNFDAEMNLKEMEAFAGLVYAGFKNIDLYGGGYYSLAEGDCSTENKDKQFNLDCEVEQDIAYGGFAGIDLRNDVFRAGLEVRGGSEFAIGMHFNYTFRIKKESEE